MQTRMRAEKLSAWIALTWVLARQDLDYDIRQIQQRQKGIVDVEGRGIEKRLKPIAPNLEEIKIQLWTDL